MYQHVLGACEAGASLRENVHQLRRARAWRRRPRRAARGCALDGPGRRAIGSERATARPDATVRNRSEDSPRALPPAGDRPPAGPSQGRRAGVRDVDPGYLVDVIYLRDLWMHRVDLHQALGRPFVATAEHDGRIVADVVAEWARRHGEPFVLELTGPAGSTYAGRCAAPPRSACRWTPWPSVAPWPGACRPRACSRPRFRSRGRSGSEPTVEGLRTRSPSQPLAPRAVTEGITVRSRSGHGAFRLIG